jgi:hypothetical protein
VPVANGESVKLLLHHGVRADPPRANVPPRATPRLRPRGCVAVINTLANGADVLHLGPKPNLWPQAKGVDCPQEVILHGLVVGYTWGRCKAGK